TAWSSEHFWGREANAKALVGQVPPTNILGALKLPLSHIKSAFTVALSCHSPRSIPFSERRYNRKIWAFPISPDIRTSHFVSQKGKGLPMSFQPAAEPRERHGAPLTWLSAKARNRV